MHDRGIDFSPVYTGEVMDNVSGGLEPGAVYAHNLNLPFTIALDKLTGWWDGGMVHANAFWIAGRSISADKVGDLGGVNNIAAYDTVRLHELWFQQLFWDAHASLQFGLLAADDNFFSSDVSALFLNGTFGAFPFVAANLPSPPIYPMGAPGVRFWIQPVPHLYVQAGVYDGNAEAQNVNRNGIDFRVSRGDGALVFSEIGWNSDWKLPGTYKLGSFVHTGNFPDWKTGAGEGTDYGIYGVVDQDLYQRGQKVISFFTRGGGTPADVNRVDWYVDAGFNFSGFIPGRPDDVAGIALARSFFSHEFSNSEMSSGSNPFDAETVLEATWKIQISEWWTLQPDFQYVWSPGGETSAHNATVLGLRTTIAF